VSGLCPGTYVCIVTDSKNCKTTKTISLTQPSSALVATGSSVNSNCNKSDGSAMVSASGGTPAYHYQWNGTSGGPVLNGIPAASYTCVVSDSLGCSDTAIVSVQTTGAGLLSLFATSEVTCYGGTNGAANAIVTGGTAPFHYTWINLPDTSNSITNLSAGTYTCSVSDAHACVVTQTIVISQPLNALSLTEIISNASCDLANGSVLVTVSGGTPAYTYQWAPSGGNSANAVHLLAGVYSVTVTDSNACVAVQQIQVYSEEQNCLDIPNAITPNEDGINDPFEIRGIDKYPNNSITIFNRWGNIVYEAEHYDNVKIFWDGKNHGSQLSAGTGLVPQGTYYYLLKLNESIPDRKGYIFVSYSK
jgi:large repetitive protein